MESGAAAAAHVSALLLLISGPPQHAVLLILELSKLTKANRANSHLAEIDAAVEGLLRIRDLGYDLQQRGGSIWT